MPAPRYQTLINLGRVLTTYPGFGASQPTLQQAQSLILNMKTNVMSCHFIPIKQWLKFFSVYHLNWLHAQAQNNQWAEELNLTKREMQWTILWYVHMAEKWSAHWDSAANLSLGHQCYAEKQIAMWNELRQVMEHTYVLQFQ